MPCRSRCEQSAYSNTVLHICHSRLPTNSVTVVVPACLRSQARPSHPTPTTSPTPSLPSASQVLCPDNHPSQITTMMMTIIIMPAESAYRLFPDRGEASSQKPGRGGGRGHGIVRHHVRFFFFLSSISSPSCSASNHFRQGVGQIELW